MKAVKDKMPQYLIQPHGGLGLVDRHLPENDRVDFVDKLIKHKSYAIRNGDLSIFYRFADGTLSPLEGPMSSAEFYRVLDEEVIERGGKKYAWSIPLAFPINKIDADALRIGETVTVKNERNVIIGSLEISDIYYFDKIKYNRAVYGTDRADHPGCRIFSNDPRDYLLGGRITALPELKHPLYGKYLLSPGAARDQFHKKGWERIIAFQTRNPLHRAHEYAMVYALEKLTKEGCFAGVVLNPLVGEVKKDDIPADVRMRTYEVLIEQRLIGCGNKDEDFWRTKEYDLTDQLMLIAIDMRMFYAGPKEALMHAIYRQNMGFTDIIIGRKHADAPFDDGEPVWSDFAAQEKFDRLNGELLIRPLMVGNTAYFEELGKVALIDEHKDKSFHQIPLSGKDLRKKLESGEPIDERVMRKPVAEILGDAYRHNISGLRRRIKSADILWHESGVTKLMREEKFGHRAAVVWLTGLPSSGKTTISNRLQSILFTAGCNVFILDGDNIRHGLNRDLGFSPEDREENIRRIGEVAKLFSEAGFIVAVAFVSPYRKDRDSVRSLFARGDFIEVYVKASVSTCEKRDAKGLYRMARLGELKEFTGVNAPYEEPLNAELTLDTENQAEDESVNILIDYLKRNHYIPDLRAR